MERPAAARPRGSDPSRAATAARRMRFQDLNQSLPWVSGRDCSWSIQKFAAAVSSARTARKMYSHAMSDRIHESPASSASGRAAEREALDASGSANRLSRACRWWARPSRRGSPVPRARTSAWAAEASRPGRSQRFGHAGRRRCPRARHSASRASAPSAPPPRARTRSWSAVRGCVRTCAIAPTGWRCAAASPDATSPRSMTPRPIANQRCRRWRRPRPAGSSPPPLARWTALAGPSPWPSGWSRRAARPAPSRSRLRCSPTSRRTGSPSRRRVWPPGNSGRTGIWCSPSRLDARSSLATTGKRGRRCGVGRCARRPAPRRPAYRCDPVRAGSRHPRRPGDPRALHARCHQAVHARHQQARQGRGRADGAALWASS